MRTLYKTYGFCVTFKLVVLRDTKFENLKIVNITHQVYLLRTIRFFSNVYAALLTSAPELSPMKERFFLISVCYLIFIPCRRVHLSYCNLWSQFSFLFFSILSTIFINQPYQILALTNSRYWKFIVKSCPFVLGQFLFRCAKRA